MTQANAVGFVDMAMECYPVHVQVFSKQRILLRVTGSSCEASVTADYFVKCDGWLGGTTCHSIVFCGIVRNDQQALGISRKHEESLIIVRNHQAKSSTRSPP